MNELTRSQSQKQKVHVTGARIRIELEVVRALSDRLMSFGVYSVAMEEPL